jgi:IclR family pca regulon transcriptional regulator
VERPEDRPAEFVEALAKGLAILECFDASHPEMTLSEVARRVGLSPAAARRSLITLSALGYVGQREKRFHLKPRIMALGSAFYFATRSTSFCSRTCVTSWSGSATRPRSLRWTART